MEKRRKTAAARKSRSNGQYNTTVLVNGSKKSAFTSKNRINCPACGGSGCSNPECCRDCPLAGQKIMVIGGLDRLEPSYKEVVTQMGGRFGSHTGHVCNGGKKLKKQVNGADLVVFFTSINSHSALSVIKAHCKKRGIPLMAVKETGKGALEKALRTSLEENFLLTN